MTLSKRPIIAAMFCLIAAPSFAAPPQPKGLEEFIDIKDFVTCETGSELSQFRTKTFPVSKIDQGPFDILQHIPLKFRKLFSEQPARLGPNGTSYYRFFVTGHWNGFKLGEFRIGESVIDEYQFIEIIFNEKIDNIRAFLDLDWKKNSAKHAFYKTLDRSNLSLSYSSKEPDKTIITCVLLEQK
jgi:hypothetical protein